MSWTNDFRQAARRLVRRPGFLALGSLGLGAGLAGVAPLLRALRLPPSEALRQD